MNFHRLIVTSALTIFGIYAGLIVSLAWFFDPSVFMKCLLSERTFYSVGLSIIAASLATLLSLGIALPAAYALSRFDFKGKMMIDTLLELPMIVSPAALGAMLLIFFNNPLGLWLQENAMRFVFTFYGIVLAQFITILGVSTRLIKAALDEIPQRYEDVARTLGATHFQAFRSITLPLCKRGIYAAAVLSWAKALGEFGATLTVAGSMPMKTETLPIAIFMRLASAEIEQSVVLIVILISIGLILLYGARLISGRKRYA